MTPNNSKYYESLDVTFEWRQQEKTISHMGMWQCVKGQLQWSTYRDLLPEFEAAFGFIEFYSKNPLHTSCSAPDSTQKQLATSW